MTSFDEYQWSHSPEQEARLRADEFAGESGRYPSRLMRRTNTCNTNRCNCNCTPTECEVHRDLGRACETHTGIKE